MMSENLVNTGYSHGLLPDGAKPLPAPETSYFALVNKVLWHSAESNFISAQTTILGYEFENIAFRIIATSPRGQWINSLWE